VRFGKPADSDGLAEIFEHEGLPSAIHVALSIVDGSPRSFDSARYVEVRAMEVLVRKLHVEKEWQAVRRDGSEESYIVFALAKFVFRFIPHAVPSVTLSWASGRSIHFPVATNVRKSVPEVFPRSCLHSTTTDPHTNYLKLLWALTALELRGS